MKSFNVIVLLGLLLHAEIFAQEPSTERVSIIGEGATFPQPLYSEWFFAYSLIKPDVAFSYTGTGSGAGRRAVRNGLVDFAGSDAPLTASDLQLNPNLVQVPFLAGAVVPFYKISTLSAADPAIIFERSVLTDIFRGVITKWNDPRILADNPSISSKLPNVTINVVLRGESSGTTNIFTSFMSSVSSEWKSTYGTVDTWPEAIRNQSNFLTAQGSFGIYALVESTDNSISYVSLSFLVDQTVTYGQMINKNGMVVSADSESVQVAMDTAEFDSRRAASIVDLPADNAWPVAGFTYIIIGSNITEDCNKRREMMRAFRWMQTAEAARARATKQGYAPLTEQLASETVSALASVTCDSQELLAVELLPQHQGAGFDTVFGLSMAAFGIALIASVIFVIIGKKNRDLPGLEYAFTAVMFGGSTLIAISSIFWYLLPDSNTICHLRVWFLTFGITLILASMFSRTWLYLRIYNVVHRLRKFNYKVRYTLESLAGMAATVTLQLVIMIVWQVMDPYNSSIVITDDINIYGKYQCQSSMIQTWVIVELVFTGAILIWGVYVVYQAWDLRQKAKDSKWLLIGIYNFIVTICVLVPLVATSVNTDDDMMFYIIVCGIVFINVSTILCVYIPKVFIQYKTYSTSRTSRVVSMGEISTAQTPDGKHRKSVISRPLPQNQSAQSSNKYPSLNSHSAHSSKNNQESYPASEPNGSAKSSSGSSSSSSSSSSAKSSKDN
jgi:phosphate transport system substrate-binding protein